MTKIYWSAKVTKESSDLDLEEGEFTRSDPEKIARSLKHSAERSHRRKAPPFRSAAMSMLNFYINRAGKNLSEERRFVLEKAKVNPLDLKGLQLQIDIVRCGECEES